MKNSHEVAIEKLKTNIEEIRNKITLNKSDRKDPLRSEKLQKLESLKREESILDAKLEEMKFNDPDEIDLIKKRAQSNKESADRWTDNAWTVKSYLTKKKNMNGKEVLFL